MIATGLFFLLRVLCYAALLLVLAGFGALILVSLLDVCPILNEGAIRCDTPLWQDIARFGMTVMLLTVFTGVPGLLAIGGVVFLLRKAGRWMNSDERRGLGVLKPGTPARRSGDRGYVIIVAKMLAVVLGLIFLAGIAVGVFDAYYRG